MLAVGLLLAYMSPYFDPNQFWLFSMFGLIYPVLLLGNLIMVIFWLLVEFKYMFLPLLTILIGWTHLKGFVNFSTQSNEPGDLTIMSYNVGFFYNVSRGTKAEKETKKLSLLSFLKAQKDVDVFCFQEFSKHSKKIVKSVFPNYYVHEVKGKGVYMFSRYPIVSQGEIDFGTKTNSCLWADLKIRNELVRVYSTHLQSNRVSKDAVQVINNVNLQEKETWDGVLGILRKYRNTSRKRANQAKMISNHASQCNHTTIISGDVNDPPTSYIYNQLCGEYQDSFIEAGSGIGTTYAGRIPMLRIDYIFADKNLEVESLKVLKEPFSDHYPVKGVYSFLK